MPPASSDEIVGSRVDAALIETIPVRSALLVPSSSRVRVSLEETERVTSLYGELEAEKDGVGVEPSLPLSVCVASEECIEVVVAVGVVDCTRD